MEKLKKNISKEWLSRSITFINENKVYVTLWLFTLATLLPLFMLTYFASPAADDFSQSHAVIHFLPNNYNMFQYLQTTIKYSFEIYKQIQGAFFVNLLIALNPMVFSISLMPFVYIANLFFFVFANYYFSDTISRKVLGGDRKLSLAITSIILITTLQFIPLAESFYWYAGIIAYTFPYALALLFLAGVINTYKKVKSWKSIILLALLGFLLGGTNFPLGLFLVVILFFTSVLTFIYRKELSNKLFTLSGFLVVGFLINVLSPGNNNRLAMRANLGLEKVQPVKAVILSFWALTVNLSHIIAFTTVLFFAILLLPKISSLLKRIEFDFRWPLLVTVLSICALAALFTPGYYAGIGDAIPGRYINIVSTIIVWTLFINVFYWIGWAGRRDNFAFELKGSLLLIILAVLSLQVPLSTEKLHNVSSVVATTEILGGTAGSYKRQVDAMYQDFKSQKGKDVVYKITAKPLTLKNIVIDKKSSYWENYVLAKFFDLNSIRNGE